MRTKDSDQISQAVQFFDQINWKLKKAEEVSPGKILFIFQAEHFEFQTTIDISRIHTITSITYEVKRIKTGSNNQKFKAVVISKIKKHFGYELLVMKKFVSLEALFQRFYFLGIRNEVSFIDENILSFLYGKIYDGLINEFEYINNSFLTFLEKYLGTQLRINNSRKSQFEYFKLQAVKSCN